MGGGARSLVKLLALAPVEIALRHQVLALAPGDFASDVAAFEATTATDRPRPPR